MKIMLAALTAASCASPERRLGNAPDSDIDRMSPDAAVTPRDVGRDSAGGGAGEAGADAAVLAAMPDAPSSLVDVAGAPDQPAAGAMTALLVGAAKTEGDPVFKKRLQDMGFRVSNVLDTAPKPAAEFTVILITESAESDALGTKYTASRSPIVTSENRLISRLGMSSAPFVVDRKLDGQTSITIINAGHPLAAGLAGKTDVYTAPGMLDFAIDLAPSAIKVATASAGVPEAASKYVLFAYDKGAILSDGKPAPARRVAWFPEDEDVARMNASGWKLFEACINWATGR